MGETATGEVNPLKKNSHQTIKHHETPHVTVNARAPLYIVTMILGHWKHPCANQGSLRLCLIAWITWCQ